MADQPDPPPAVLFDIDGTLDDSNYLHIHAWCRAFDEVGIAVDDQSGKKIALAIQPNPIPATA